MIQQHFLFVNLFVGAIKKAGNARRKLLAYRSFFYIQTMQNGKVDFAQFPIASKKRATPAGSCLAYRSFFHIQTMQNGKVGSPQFPMAQKSE